MSLVQKKKSFVHAEVESVRLCKNNSTTATIIGAVIINRANEMFGVVISGKITLPYFIAAPPATEPTPSFTKKFESSCNYHKISTREYKCEYNEVVWE